jgi:flagellar biosynthesis chaperone FliJ
LLSLALVSHTKGETRPGQWAERLLKENWKSLAKESISMVRTIKETDEAYDYLFENDKDPRMLRDHLRDFVKSRDSHQQWTGYKAFIRYREERRRHQALDTLIRSLIKSLVKRQLYWMKDPIEGPTCADEALNTLLFRATTGLGFAQKDIILTEKEFRHLRTQYENMPDRWIEDGQQRYEALLPSIPDPLRSVIDEKWFHKHLAKGPPKVKNWEAEVLPGVTGLYYYQTYL